MNLSSRNKASDHQRNDTFREIHQLDLKIQKFEKDQHSFLTNKRTDLYGELTSIEELLNSLLDCRKKEGVRLKNKLERIRGLVGKFLEQIQNVKSTPEFVAMVKRIMEDVEAAITEYKEQQRIEFENLLRSELSLWQECALLERKIEAWEKGQDVDTPCDFSGMPKTGQLTGKMDITKDLPFEVAEMERFLQQYGGRTGGWSELDHQTFLKYRQKHHGGHAFIRDVVSALVVKTLDQVQEHENWYKEFLRLDDNKKEAIRRWKEHKKTRSRPGELDATDFDGDDYGSGTSARSNKSEWEKKRHELEAKRAAVDTWRKEREEEKLREKREEEKRIRLVIEEKEKEKMRRQDEVKRRLAEYHQEKEDEEDEKLAMAILKEAREREEVKRKIESSSSRVKCRNEQLTDRKLQYQKVKEAEAKEKALRLERLKSQVEVLVPRDPSRLLQPTSGWIERVKSGHNESNPRQISSAGVFNMPHKAVPSWRQGLS